MTFCSRVMANSLIMKKVRNFLVLKQFLKINLMKM